MVNSLNFIINGRNFADVLQVVCFVSKEMATAVNTADVTGTLDHCFCEFIKPLKQIFDAKLELFKFICVGIVINYGLLGSLLLSIPLMLPKAFCESTMIFLSGIRGIALLRCVRAGICQYHVKSTNMNTTAQSNIENPVFSRL